MVSEAYAVEVKAAKLAENFRKNLKDFTFALKN